jgi:hypothetical protein
MIWSNIRIVKLEFMSFSATYFERIFHTFSLYLYSTCTIKKLSAYLETTIYKGNIPKSLVYSECVKNTLCVLSEYAELKSLR